MNPSSSSGRLVKEHDVGFTGKKEEDTRCSTQTPSFDGIQLEFPVEPSAAEFKKLKEENKRLRVEINQLHANGFQPTTQDQQPCSMPNISSQDPGLQQTSKKMKELEANVQRKEEAVTKAEQQATVATQQKDEAVERTRQYQRQETFLLHEIAELRAALAVATRCDQPAPPDQRLNNSIKEEEQLSAAENGAELVRKRKENIGRDFASQTASVDDIQPELASRTRELQSQLDDRTKQLQDAEALLKDRTDELRLIQTQLDDRTNQIRQMAITFESQAAEMNKLKEENERIRGEINLPANDSQLATQDESLNLPNVSNQSSLSQQTSKKMKEMTANIQKLTEMNVQWQKYNQKRDAQIKKYEKKIEELKIQIRNLNISSEVFVLTKAQQERINGFYQRIRRAAEQTYERLETALEEAQQQLRDCRQRMEEAEQRAAVAIQQKNEVVERANEFERQVEELNRQVTSLLQEAEELRAALVVATRRHDHQAPPDQRLINNLKMKVDDLTMRFRIMVLQMNELKSKNRCYLSLVRRCLDLFEAIHTRDQATIDELRNELANAQRGRLLTEANEIAELRSELEVARRECEDRDDLIETQMLNIRQLRELVDDLSRRLAGAANAHAVNNAGDADP